MRTNGPFIATCWLGLSLGVCAACGPESPSASGTGGQLSGSGGETDSGGRPGSGGTGGQLSGGAASIGGSAGGDPSSDQPCRTSIQIDLKGDGSIDETHEYVYDSTGNLVRDEADLAIPYDIQVTTAYTYDAAGNVLTKLEDRSDQPPSRSTYHYRDDGQLDLIEHDRGDDESVERTDDYVYGADGLLTEVKLVDVTSPTILCDTTWLGASESRLDCREEGTSSLQQSTRRLRNDRGQLLEFERYSPDDGSSLQLDVYSYDDSGLLLQVEKEAPAGDPYSVITYTYDDDRNLVSVEEIADDGAVFSRSTYQHTFQCDSDE